MTAIARPDSRSTANVDGASRGPGEQEAAPNSRPLVRSIARVLAFNGFTMSINGIGAPWIAKSFHLGEPGIAGLFAWISLSALGALGLSRMIDRLGRRRMLLVCMAGTAVSALAAAFSTNIAAFVLCEIALYAFIGATVASGVVILAEELPIEERARGQSWGGLGMGLGGGLCLIMMPMVASRYSWRWMLVLASVMGVAGLRRAAKVIPESGRWQHAAESGTTSASSFYDAFGPLYRRRAITILICSLLGTIAAVAASSWAYFHLVSVVGLAPRAASGLMLVGGGVGMLGFPLGARGCERYGRIPTIFVAGLLTGLGALAFYWGPPAHLGLRWLWIEVTYCCFTAGLSAGQVGGNSLATELFPTAIRGAMMGWFSLVGAAAAVSAQTLIAVFAARLGGLSIVVGYLSLLAIPNAIIVALLLPETRGLSLEAAAMEEAFENSQ
ncbi:MAG TPA: MFS transporter [Candidatus Binatus sp.]|uniref:MFS transporter n=1 Tax=Candidatus Binatus sp. TaxID=2811406 RepID=UPI002B47EF9C|nr:MFS transporter [Candidatus Binatus sp.]HKN12905.1 MFS transporter [Candidatus Binatus sp.]